MWKMYRCGKNSVCCLVCLFFCSVWL
ncbi:hypothetical protein NC652_015541 [Populus alba x Populus x berolinensis]|nr:hypothetical protein NC652_015541 [Populus alba x Populus x berolinensis]